MPGREKTSQQEWASYSVITTGTFQNGPWDDLTYIYIYFFGTVFLRLLQLTSPLACRGPSFFYSSSVSVLLSLILFSQACTAPPNDANQFSQEIRTPVTSGACSSRLIRPIWTTDKSKRFLPLVPSAEIPLKICSCLLQSVPHFFHWCSISFFSFFWW